MDEMTEDAAVVLINEGDKDTMEFMNSNGIGDGEEGASEVHEEDDPIDLKVRNVVTMFHTCSHIDLRLVANRMCHVVYDRRKGVIEKVLKTPHACVKIWSSGKVILAGARSEQDALVASRRTARLLQKIIGPKVKFASYRITNIMATCRLPFGIRIDNMARGHPKEASYEPELNTGLIWKSTQPKATVRIHTTGSIIVTGALSSADIVEVLTGLYPILLQFQCQRPSDDASKSGQAAATVMSRARTSHSGNSNSSE